MEGFLEKLKEVISTVFNEYLDYYLTVVLQKMIPGYFRILFEAFVWWIYWLYTSLLSVVDFLTKIFDFFSGSEPVVYNNTEVTTVLGVFLSLPAVQKAFWVITFLSLGLSLLFSIYAVAKSMSDMILENKNPIGKVLGNSLKACITFLLVPVLCLFMMRLSSIILKGIETSLRVRITIDQNEIRSSPSVGTVLWVTSSMNAAMDDAYNISTTDGSVTPSFADELRRDYLEQGAGGEALWAYGNIEQIRTDFAIERFDYGLGFISAIFMILVLTAGILLLIRRIFEIVILFLVAPLFVSTMPLDDGAYFSKWKDMFIAKFFSAFGSVFAMRLYVMLVPVLASGEINLYPSNAEAAYFMQTLFILGGAYAIYKSQGMLLRILNPEAAAAVEQSAGAIMTVATGAVGVARAGMGAVAMAGSKGGSGSSGSGSNSKGGSSGSKGTAGGSAGGGQKGSQTQQFKGKS